LHHREALLDTQAPGQAQRPTAVRVP
jgi:hypothetical protein